MSTHPLAAYFPDGAVPFALAVLWERDPRAAAREARLPWRLLIGWDALRRRGGALVHVWCAERHGAPAPRVSMRAGDEIAARWYFRDASATSVVARGSARRVLAHLRERPPLPP